jgi:hypothetical protein
MIQQLVQGLGLNGVRPTDEGGIVWHRLPVDATELAQDQAVPDPLLGLRVAPAVEVFDDEHAQHHLDGRGRPPVRERVGMTRCQISFNQLKEGVIIEQLVELGQHRFHLSAQRRHPRENIQRVIAIT